MTRQERRRLQRSLEKGTDEPVDEETPDDILAEAARSKSEFEQSLAYFQKAQEHKEQLRKRLNGEKPDRCFEILRLSLHAQNNYLAGLRLLSNNLK